MAPANEAHFHHRCNPSATPNAMARRRRLGGTSRVGSTTGSLGATAASLSKSPTSGSAPPSTKLVDGEEWLVDGEDLPVGTRLSTVAGTQMIRLDVPCFACNDLNHARVSARRLARAVLGTATPGARRAAGAKNPGADARALGGRPPGAFEAKPSSARRSY